LNRRDITEQCPWYTFHSQTVVLGIFILGCCHSTLAIKTAHIAAHGSLTTNKTLQNMLSHFVSDICGSFSADLGYDIHIKVMLENVHMYIWYWQNSSVDQCTQYCSPESKSWYIHQKIEVNY
jgi:hypothetical protein